MNYYRANLENRDLHGQNFDGVDFRKAKLQMAILEDVNCEPKIVKRMEAGAWIGSFIAELSIELLISLISRGQNSGGGGNTFPPLFKKQMESTDFSEADLTGANLKRAKLRETNFHSAILRNADLSKATLIDADLSEADLSNANLSYTDMSGALLYKTNLEGADLTGAKLDATDFEGANLTNANFRDVDLRKVKYINTADLIWATTSDGELNDSVESKYASKVQTKSTGTTSHVFDGSKCPSCGKKIRGTDTICQHCGRFLDAPLSKAELQSLAQPYLDKAMKAFETGKNLKGALSNSNKAIKYIPASAEAHNLRGIILDALRNIDEAILEYQEAIRLDPDFEDAKANLAGVQEEYLYIPPHQKNKAIKKIKENSPESKFSASMQVKHVDAKDLFLKTLSRATSAGALAGLVGTIVGMVTFALISGLMEGYFTNGTIGQISLGIFTFVAPQFICTPFPLLGAATGALIGRLSANSNRDLEDETSVFRYGIIGGGIAGFAIGGILPHACGWLFNSVFHMA